MYHSIKWKEIPEILLNRANYSRNTKHGMFYLEISNLLRDQEGVEAFC